MAFSFLPGLTKDVVESITAPQRGPEGSTKALKISRILTSAPIDAGYKIVLANLMTEILGEKIAISPTTLPPLFTAVVFTSSSNGHNYLLNTVCICDQPHNRCWNKGGSVGNNPPLDRFDGSWRLATKEEIEEAFKE